MNQFIPLLVGIFALALGSILGYYARQSIAKKKIGTIEEKLQKKLSQVQKESEIILTNAKEKANQILEAVKKEESQRRQELLQTERLLLRRENILDKKISNLEIKEREFRQKVAKLKKIKEGLESLQKQALENLERTAQLSREEAKKELLANLEKEYQQEILERMKKLESEGWQRYERKAKELVALAIQKVAISQAQEITTTTVSLPDEEIKGRIIGKEGRNIRTLEKLTGVEILIDETPEVVVISAFDPIRRQIAKTALEKLILDGRIQPARIEEKVEEAKKEISNQIREAGETAVYEMGLLGLDPKLVQLLGRLRVYRRVAADPGVARRGGLVQTMVKRQKLAARRHRPFRSGPVFRFSVRGGDFTGPGGQSAHLPMGMAPCAGL